MRNFTLLINYLPCIYMNLFIKTRIFSLLSILFEKESRICEIHAHVVELDFVSIDGLSLTVRDARETRRVKTGVFSPSRLFDKESSGRCRIATRVVASFATISGSFLSSRHSLEDWHKSSPSCNKFLCEERHPN